MVELDRHNFTGKISLIASAIHYCLDCEFQIYWYVYWPILKVFGVCWHENLLDLAHKGTPAHLHRIGILIPLKRLLYNYLV